MDEHLKALVWRGIVAANPWWQDGRVPPHRTAPFRRHAFPYVHDALAGSDRGRGVVLLGPRRVGKTVLLHQVVERLLDDRRPATSICLLSLDDVALRDRDLGELLELVEARCPLGGDAPRVLLLDEIQHSPSWAGWLKRIADRRDPYVFLATGSSATALRYGGQDAGVGRWREVTLFPWSFREHVQLRSGPAMPRAFEAIDRRLGSGDASAPVALQISSAEAEELDTALVDYLLRGGFPEAALATDLAEARRRLRQDILDRALGRDITDAVSADPRLLERMFLRICLNPGGLWSATNVARELEVSRPVVGRYLEILERAFLVFRWPNLASPIKGQPKVYLVAPALRQALLDMDESHVGVPEEWGRMAENAMAATLIGTRPTASSVGFWRKGSLECDGVSIEASRRPASEFIEVKRSGKRAVAGIERARAALTSGEGSGTVLTRGGATEWLTDTRVLRQSLALWLYQQDAAAGGTLRVKLA